MFYGRLRLIDRSNIISNCIILFHDFCLILIITIFFFVCFMLFISINRINYTIKEIIRSNFLEISWTIIPIFFLLSLRLPSFLIIYYLERESKRDLTYKRIRHQWYWSYENNDFDFNLQFDSYIIRLENLNKRNYRLMEVDNSLILPYISKIRIIITSSDVLHSWSLPIICLKVDAVPRRLNTLNMFSTIPRSLYGQCSEICRINHSFIPIHVEFIKWNNYIKALI